MRLHCPSCDALVGAATLNVAKDIGICGGCQNVFTISEAVRAGRAELATFTEGPPSGAALVDTAGGFMVKATTRHPAAFLLVPFMLMWSGLSLGGIYGSQIASGHFHMALSLFGLPFLIVSAWLWPMALMSVAGKVRVSVRGEVAEVFVGVGPVGWRRRFLWDAVTAVRVEDPKQERIVLQGGARGTGLRFGTALSVERREFMVSALRSKLTQRARPIYR